VIYAIGDVHGEAGKLRELLSAIRGEGLAPSDRLVFVGDYVDRGSGVPEVLDTLLALREERSNTIFLRGNHDQGMLDARNLFDPTRPSKHRVEDVGWWFEHGGTDTIDAYKADGRWFDRIPEGHWKFLEETEMEFREGGYWFVHAGVLPPGHHWPHPEAPRLWIREDFLHSNADFGAVVVFGHTPQRSGDPLVMSNKIGIDTAAAYGGPLTAVRLDPFRPYDPSDLHFLQAFD